MYHPGKVVEVIRPTDKEVHSSDSSVQATLDMWDENTITFLVSPKIANQIKSGQVVLVDYRPDEKIEAPVPSHIIVKILEGKKATTVWNAYTQMHDKRKRKASNQAVAQQSYIG